MKRGRIAVIICTLFLTALVLTSCKGITTQNNSGLQTVKVAFDNAPSEAGIILGDKLGFFEKQGIKIEYVQFNSGADELTSIVSNQVDVSRGIINAGLFNAANLGVGLKLVADGGHNIPNKGYFQIALKKGLGEKYKDYKDMKGMRVAIASVGSINQLFVEKALEKGGLTSKDIKFVIVDSFPDMLTAVANGNADATMQIEPLITKGVDEGILEWWKDPDEYATGEEISVVMYSPNFVKNKELCNKFMVAYLQGVRAFNDAFISGNKDQDKIIDILTKTTFVDSADIFRRMKPPGLDPDGYVLKQGVIADQEWYMSQGLVKSRADVDKLVDNSYVEYALTVLGKYKK
jgi:ABC-type nitrate/sulfonate/bicarbonate transport systems, periplasmic components